MKQPYKNNIIYRESPTVQKVEARCFGASYSTRKRQKIYNIFDRAVGESSVTPTVYIQDKIMQLRKASSLSLSQRCERLKKAGQIYQEETLANLKAETYVALVADVTGLQQKIIVQSLANISHALCNMNEILQVATPAGAVWDSDNFAVNEGCSLFSRRGDVLSIIAAGNGPGVHGLWPQAIAMGYRVLIRPSSREPFTAQRLVCALELAGLTEYVALIPTDYKGVETLLAQSDLGVVYGNSNTILQYGNNARVLVQGPGHAKIVIGKDISHDEAIAVAAQSVLSLGGAACVSASAILVEDNPAEFARKLRIELKSYSHRQFFTLAKQKEAEAYKKALRFDDVPWTYDRTSADACILRPHVTLVENASDAKVQRELPFPCVTIAPFNQKEDCYKALSGSLVVTVLSRQKNLINKILEDVSIANVYIGNIATSWMNFRVPHDGYLADFLMCNRGIRVDAQWLKRDF